MRTRVQRELCWPASPGKGPKSRYPTRGRPGRRDPPARRAMLVRLDLSVPRVLRGHRATRVLKA